MDMIEDIWKQPVAGFTAESKGRTEEQIAQKEAEIGFRFPLLYREHMKLQNGGYIWKAAFCKNGEVHELLYNGSTITPILGHGGHNTLKDVLLEYMDEEELNGSSSSEFLNLDRLPILSYMDGHTMLCFDYGYNVESEYETPEIVHFELEGAENGFEEKLRVGSYDELIDHLVYYGYESTSYYIGLRSEEQIERIAERIGSKLGLQLETRTDDGYGWCNYETWYLGELAIGSDLSAQIKLLPNQSLSDTYLFQNSQDHRYIVDVELRIGYESLKDNSDFVKGIIEEKLKPFLQEEDWDFLLIPYHVDNVEELENLKEHLNH